MRKPGVVDLFLGFQLMLGAAFGGIVLYGLGDWVGVW